MWTPFAEALGQNRCGMLLGIRGSMEAGADAAGRQGGRHDGGGPGPWIQSTGGGEEYLPVSHTCFNLLDLPKYTDKETLRSKLIQAIDHNEGFSLI